MVLGALTWQTVPLSESTNDFITAADSELKNWNEAIVLQPVQPNRPIKRDSVMPVTSGTQYADVLNPGMRAISIPLQVGASTTSLVQPGVRVDVVLTFTPTGNSSAPTPNGAGGGGAILGGGNNGPSTGITQYISRTLLHNVLVLDVYPKGGGGGGILSGFGSGSGQWAVLEVSPQQVQALAVATQIGQLSVSLRSVTGKTLTGLGPTDTQMVSGLPGIGSGQSVTIIRGTATTQQPVE